MARTKVTNLQLYNPVKFEVYRNAAWSTGANAFGLLACDTKVYDSGSNVDVVTNKGRFTAPYTGYYWFDAGAAWSGASVNSTINFYLNGVAKKYGILTTAGATHNSAQLQLNAGDYVEAWLFTASSQTGSTSATYTWFSGFLIGTT